MGGFLPVLGGYWSFLEPLGLVMTKKHLLNFFSLYIFILFYFSYAELGYQLFKQMI
jgi:hypothetical protein